MLYIVIRTKISANSAKLMVEDQFRYDSQEQIVKDTEGDIFRSTDVLLDDRATKDMKECSYFSFRRIGILNKIIKSVVRRIKMEHWKLLHVPTEQNQPSSAEEKVQNAIDMPERVSRTKMDGTVLSRDMQIQPVPYSCEY